MRDEVDHVLGALGCLCLIMLAFCLFMVVYTGVKLLTGN